MPKPLIEVDGKPIIQHIFELFPGVTDIHCICNREHVETTPMRTVLEGMGATVHVIEPHSLGPVWAVAQIMNSVIYDEDEVIISYCDYGTVWNFRQFKELADQSNTDGIIVAYKGFHPHMLGTDNYAFLKCSADNGCVEAIREKEPFTTDRMSEYASNGTYYFKRGADVKRYFTEVLESGTMWQKNGEYYVSVVYNLMIRDGLLIRPFEIQKMLQWGTPHDLEEYLMWGRHFRQPAQPECRSAATLILPMAGQGSRFQMQGFQTPKPLLPVGGKPMVVRAVGSIPHCERTVFVCLNEHLEKYDLETTLMREIPDQVEIYGINKTTEGQACTCEIALQRANIPMDCPIMISACDNGVDYNHAAYMQLENDPTVDVIVWGFSEHASSRRYPHMYAWLNVDNSQNIHHVSVKKHFEGAKYAIIGTMFFRRASIYAEGLAAIYGNNIRTNGEFYVDDLLNPLIHAGYNVKMFHADSYICWGTPADYKTYKYWEEHFAEPKQ